MTLPAVSDPSILERAGAVITPTSLTLPDPHLDYETMEELAGFLGRLSRSCAWWTGDLLLQIEMRYGEKVAQAAEATGLAPQTLMNRMSVCSHVPRARRRKGVPFSVHAEVAYKTPEEQEEWLDRAQQQQWTRAELREHLHQRDQDDVPKLPPEVETPCTCPSCGHTHYLKGE